MLHWVESSVQTHTHTHNRTHAHPHHTGTACLPILFTNSHEIKTLQQNNIWSLWRQTRVLGVWLLEQEFFQSRREELLEHSALVSGLALTTASLAGSERSSARLHAPQTLIMMPAARTVLQISDQPLRPSHSPPAWHDSVWLVRREQP